MKSNYVLHKKFNIIVTDCFLLCEDFNLEEIFLGVFNLFYEYIFLTCK